MNTPYDFDKKGERLAYIRVVATKDLPPGIQAKTGNLGEIYAIHGADGQVLGLAPNRSLAMQFAQNHELSAMSVH